MSPAKLWGKTDAVMTDAATKNLSIEKSVANALRSDQIPYHLLHKSHTVETLSDHIPYHLLHKSHTVEPLDFSNLEALKKIENSVSQRYMLEWINSALKLFIWGKKATVEAGIEALLNHVTQDKSGRSCSLAIRFDSTCHREGVRKRIFLYLQCWFAKLRKAPASLLEALLVLRKLYNETEAINQWV